MNNLTGMYEEGQELDDRILAACQTLEKIAAEEDVDLGSMSQEDLQDMISHVMESGASGPNNDNGGGEGGEDGHGAGGEGAEGAEGGSEGDKAASAISTLDVVMELNKRASAEGIDLSQWSREDYEAAFEKVAAELSDPEQQKVAAVYAQMDELGRVAARGFVDEINKLAADDDKEKAKKDDDEDEDDAEMKVKKAAAKEKILAGAKALGAKARQVGSAAAGKEKSLHQGLGKRVLPNAASETQRNVGRGLTGGAAAGAAGGAYTFKKSRDKKAAYLENAALELARQTLFEAGIDPDTGTKLASDEEVQERARELLREHGYAA